MLIPSERIQTTEEGACIQFSWHEKPGDFLGLRQVTDKTWCITIYYKEEASA